MTAQFLTHVREIIDEHIQIGATKLATLLEGLALDLRRDEARLTSVLVVGIGAHSGGGWDVRTNDGLTHIVSGELLKESGVSQPIDLVGSRYLWLDDASFVAIECVSEWQATTDMAKQEALGGVDVAEVSAQAAPPLTNGTLVSGEPMKAAPDVKLPAAGADAAVAGETAEKTDAPVAPSLIESYANIEGDTANYTIKTADGIVHTASATLLSATGYGPSDAVGKPYPFIDEPDHNNAVAINRDVIPS